MLDTLRKLGGECVGELEKRLERDGLRLTPWAKELVGKAMGEKVADRGPDDEDDIGAFSMGGLELAGEAYEAFSAVKGRVKARLDNTLGKLHYKPGRENRSMDC